MLAGYAGRVGWIDLTNGKVNIEECQPLLFLTVVSVFVKNPRFKLMEFRFDCS
jgi:hypothetical protein